MIVYLAARYSRREEMCGYRSGLQRAGIEVSGRWLDGAHQIGNDGKPIGEEGEAAVELGESIAAHFAEEDIADLNAAQVVVCFTEMPRVSNSRGGRHFEMGFAYAAGKRVIVVGPRENVFCWLPDVVHFDWWDQAFGYMLGLADEAA